MRFVKSISFFLVYPMLMLMLGFYAGIKAVEFFYPGKTAVQEEKKGSMDWDEFLKTYVAETGDADALNGSERAGTAGVQSAEGQPTGSLQAETLQEGTSDMRQELISASEDAVQVIFSRETLSADTEYVLKEMDVLRQTEVETSWRLPQKYIGMNREQFLTSIESYGAHPPLSELERGFVGLEVLAFSRERVVVQMNYKYLQPGEGFYLAVQDNEVVVLLEDQETVYINTGILLEQLPEEIQMEIMQMMWVEDEESLYGFLETYSS